MSILEKIIGLYAPHVCVGCDAPGAVVCTGCIHKLPRPADRCYRCHSASSGGQTCVQCLQYGLLAVNAATCYVRMAKDIVWRLKFQRAKAAAECMAAPMARICREKLRPVTIIVPVPTASSRVRRRGYDQAVVLARAIALRAGAAYTPLLTRQGRQEQIGAGRAQRRSQLQGAFLVRNPRYVRGTHIILVDDVVTTGATLESAARALRSAGAESVEAVVFAQV